MLNVLKNLRTIKMVFRTAVRSIIKKFKFNKVHNIPKFKSCNRSFNRKVQLTDTLAKTVKNKSPYTSYVHVSKAPNKNVFRFTCAFGLSVPLLKVKQFQMLPDLTVHCEGAENDKNTGSESMRDKFNFIGETARKCAPSVIYIEIRDPLRIDLETGQPLTISNGSGFIINEDGWLLTNAHVVINKAPHGIITVFTHDGRQYNAIVKDADMTVDLALLKIQKRKNENLTALRLGNSKDVNMGEWVVALGSPLSLTHSVCAGVVSAVDRTAHELGLSNHSMHYIQTDAAITFGNSGGPLVNLDGDVIGINNLRITAGISFAIPVDYAKKFLSKGPYAKRTQDPSPSEIDTFLLGCTTLDMESSKKVKDYVLKQLDVELATDVHGVMVWKVLPGMPAYRSGLKPGDVITHINGKAVYTIKDIYTTLDKNNPKADVTLVAVRGGVPNFIKIKPEVG